MNIVRKLALAAALVAAIPAAQAAQQSFALNGQIDSGALIGQTYTGNFSFDDASLTGSGLEWLSIANLSVNFQSNIWTLADAVAPTEVAFDNGTFLGLSYSAGNSNVSFTFVPGTSALSEAFMAYDTPLGASGSGSLITTAVPEASSWALALSGLMLVGFLRRRL